MNPIRFALLLTIVCTAACHRTDPLETNPYEHQTNHTADVGQPRPEGVPLAPDGPEAVVLAPPEPVVQLRVGTARQQRRAARLNSRLQAKAEANSRRRIAAQTKSEVARAKAGAAAAVKTTAATTKLTKEQSAAEVARRKQEERNTRAETARLREQARLEKQQKPGWTDQIGAGIDSLWRIVLLIVVVGFLVWLFGFRKRS